MPKLYEYLGLIILFYSHEHDPVHVHCKFQGKESKAELIFENGEFVEARISGVSGKEPLDTQNLKKFKKFVEAYYNEIVRKWMDFFIYNKPIESEKITKKL